MRAQFGLLKTPMLLCNHAQPEFCKQRYVNSVHEISNVRDACLNEKAKHASHVKACYRIHDTQDLEKHLEDEVNGI